MEYFTEQAATYAECLKKIRSRYGDNARVLMQRSVRVGGILGFFAKEGVEMSGVVGPDPSRPSLEAARAVKKVGDPEEERRKILANLKSDQALQMVLSEVKGIKDKLDSYNAPAAAEEHPTIAKIIELLSLNDFSASFSTLISERLKRDFSLEALDDFNAVQDKVVEWVGESVSIYREDSFQVRPRIMVLVGPTGVGKTTTIAKLAALFGLNALSGRSLSVRMITIDNYRIAARQQIETYGNIMGIPVSTVETFDDLRKTIAMYQDDVDLILLDTIGKSPRDYMKLAEMKELLSACGRGADVHLAIAATTKGSDIGEILQQFEPFAYRSVVLTKLDETIRVGNVISALAEKNKAISYITDGQRVPQDISRATVPRLLINLEGFKIDRRKLDARFGRESATAAERR